jgi:autotransporter-associated beta strand protein
MKTKAPTITPPLLGSSPSLLRLQAQTFLLNAAMLLLLLSARTTTFAGSATWQLDPATGDWNTATNWTPTTEPNGSADTATFSLSNTTEISISTGTTVDGTTFNTAVDGITFAAGASHFTITVNPFVAANANNNFLTLSGVGITNNSGITQNFVTAAGANYNYADIVFTNSASAGSSTSFTNRGAGNPFTAGGVSGETRFYDTSTAANGVFTNSGATYLAGNGGFTSFLGSSTAANGTFINNGGTFTGFGIGSHGGITRFSETSTAANGTFTNNASTVSGSLGGSTQFYDASTAGNGTFTSNGSTVSGAGSGYMIFAYISTAGNATLIANGGSGGGDGGTIFFFDSSKGGTARVEVFGNGNLDISAHDFPGVTVGSIEGSGNVFLGANNLTLGSNNLNTTFSGVIQDGGGFLGDTGGSLSKIGSGKLVLSNANTYTGGTTVNAGTLLVNNTSGSGTGTGAVHVNAGTLSGSGTIAGAVTVGTKSGPGAFLSPGLSLSPGTLTIQSALTLNSDATYHFELNRHIMTADEVIANGVTINGARFSFTDLHGGAVARGTVFTIIENTAASSIAGEFTNLPDGSMFKAKGNTFEVSYEGGDGNDLTLTAIKPKKAKDNTFQVSYESGDGNNPTTTVIAAVPESNTLTMLLFGLIALLLYETKRRLQSRRVTT